MPAEECQTWAERLLTMGSTTAKGMQTDIAPRCEPRLTSKNAMITTSLGPAIWITLASRPRSCSSGCTGVTFSHMSWSALMTAPENVRSSVSSISVSSRVRSTSEPVPPSRRSTTSEATS